MGGRRYPFYRIGDVDPFSLFTTFILYSGHQNEGRGRGLLEIPGDLRTDFEIQAILIIIFNIDQFCEGGEGGGAQIGLASSSPTTASEATDRPTVD